MIIYPLFNNLKLPAAVVEVSQPQHLEMAVMEATATMIGIAVMLVVTMNGMVVMLVVMAATMIGMAVMLMVTAANTRRSPNDSVLFKCNAQRETWVWSLKLGLDTRVSKSCFNLKDKYISYLQLFIFSILTFLINLSIIYLYFIKSYLNSS